MFFIVYLKNNLIYIKIIFEKVDIKFAIEKIVISKDDISILPYNAHI